MHLYPRFEYVFKNKILEKVTDSSKLSRKGQNALKNEPIAVEDNSSMANSINIAQYLIRNLLPSVYSLADLIMERMQRSYANTGLALALWFSSKYVGMTLIFTLPSLDTLLNLKTWDLGTKIYKGGDAHNRFKWLKQFIPMESGALLCTCSLSDLIKLIIGYRGHDSLISEVEGELKLLAKESKGADDLDVALRVLEIIRNILVKRLYGSRVRSFQNPGEIISNCFTSMGSAKQGITRNGKGLAQSWRRYSDYSMLKVAGRLQKDEEKRKNEKIKIAGRLQKDEEKRKNIEKIKEVVASESAPENVINYVTTLMSISKKENMYQIKLPTIMIFTQSKKQSKKGFSMLVTDDRILHYYPRFPLK